MAEVRVVETLDAVDPAAWDACGPGAIEGHACLRAVERAGLAGFAFRYLMLEEDGVPIGAMPLFLTRYPLETTLDGGAPAMLGRIRRLCPSFLAPRLACIGSPCTETATIGLAPHLSPAGRAAAATRLIAAVEALAAREGAALIGLKDLAGADAPLWSTAAADAGFTAMPGLPAAWLPIDFPNLDGYFAGLSRATRRDLRRKLRAAPAVRIERRERIDDVIDRVMALYHATLDRADLRFETLTPAYFTGILAAAPGRAFATLYWVGDDLLAMNLLVRNDDTLLDKYFCMAVAGRRHDLYFLSWIENIRYCLDHGIARYAAGQAAYAGKVRLGCRLAPTTMLFRHRGRLMNRALRLAAPLLTPAPDFAPDAMGEPAMDDAA